MADVRLQPQSKGKARSHIDRFVAARPTLEERFAAGKALRDTLPREHHAAYAPRPGREDPLRILATQNANRLPQLVPAVTHDVRKLRHPRQHAAEYLRGQVSVSRDLKFNHAVVL